MELARSSHRDADGATGPESLTALAGAHNHTLAELLTYERDVLVFSQDVGRKGGSYGVTKGLRGHTRGLNHPGDGLWRAPGDGSEHVPIGRARVYGAGTDLTIIAFANSVERAPMATLTAITGAPWRS